MNPQIFQGNSEIFDINNYVKNYRYIWWALRKKSYRDKIKINDVVFLWRSDGEERRTGGILGKTRVIGFSGKIQ